MNRITNCPHWVLWMCMGFTLFAISCDSGIQPDSLDKWVKSNDSKSIKSHFYKRTRINDTHLEKIVQMYSDSINSQNLEARPLVDKSFKKFISGRERKGYEYYDENDNLHYSITYKLVTMPEDSSVLYNYVDFRASDENLPSVKVPGFGPIRAIYTDDKFEDRKNLASLTDSLEVVGPIELYGRQYFHKVVIDKINSKIPKDSMKSAIIFNLNNNWIKRHIDLILRGLEEKVDLSKYDLGYVKTVSTPTIRLGFDAGFNPVDLSEMLDLFAELTNKKMIVSPSFKKKFKPFTGNFYVGHSEVERKKISPFR